MKMFSPQVFAIVLALGCHRVRALFEDEVGQYEWSMQQVGQPTAIEHSGDTADVKRVYVASASGAVASILLKDGTLQWRRVASQHGGVKILRAAGNRALISATDGGLVQVWKSANGDLTWQHEYEDAVVEIVVAGPTPKQSMVIVRESEVEARSASGKHEWSVSAKTVSPDSANDVFWAGVAGPEGGDASSVCVALGPRTGAQGMTSAKIELSTGKVLKTGKLPAAAAKAVQLGQFVVVGSNLVALGDGELSAHPLCGDGESHTFDLKKVKTTSGAPFQLMPWQRAAGVVFAATNGANTAVFSADAKGLRHLRTFEGIAAVARVIGAHDDEAAAQMPVAVATVRLDATEVQLLDPASGNVREAMRTEGYSAANHGPIRLALVRELSSGEHRMVVSAADHSLATIQGSTTGKLLWVREEMLASISQAFFYGRHDDSGAKKKDKAHHAPVGMVAQLTNAAGMLAELPNHFGELVRAPFEVAEAVNQWFNKIGQSQASTESQGTMQPGGKIPRSADDLRDFGADKLILVASPSAGKMLALESTTSAVVWSRYFGATAELLATEAHCGANATKTSACSFWMQLLPDGTGHNGLLVVTPKLKVAGSMESKPQELLWIEPLTGAVVHQETSPAGKAATVASVTAIADESEDETCTTGAGEAECAVSKGAKVTVQPFLLIDTAHQAHAMPSKSAAAAKSVDKAVDRLFHYEVDQSTQSVHGFSVGRSATGGQKLTPLWNVDLSAGGESIVAIAEPAHREWDHVPVHIKGDASILYKYINGNMIVIVTQGSVESDQKGKDKGQAASVSSLNLYAIDAVTGHVIHQSRLSGGSTPVNVAVCDNWALMHYWNVKKTRFEALVLDFFEAKQDEGPWNLLFGKEGSNFTKSAHHLETPVPLQQTYILPAGVTALGVTATQRGITPRSIIMAMTTDHLFRVSKDLLNPRRPYAVTIKDDKDKIPAQFAPSKEEGVPPYAPLVPLKPTDVLSHTVAITQVRGIASSPTALESTSLVFAYGLDLFFAPVQTAKGYDALSPGFNYKLLYLSLIAVVIGVFVTSYLAQYKALQERWK